MGYDSAPSEFGESYDDERQLSGAISDQTLSDVPQRKLLTVDVGASVDDAVARLNAEHCGYALVVRDGKLAGIFTERDVLNKVVGGGKVDVSSSVEAVMTADPETLPAHASIAYALHRMHVKGYRHIPLVDDEDRPVGCVASRDIIHWIVDMLPESVLNLPPHPGSYPKSVDGG